MIDITNTEYFQKNPVSFLLVPENCAWHDIYRSIVKESDYAKAVKTQFAKYSPQVFIGFVKMFNELGAFDGDFSEIKERLAPEAEVTEDADLKKIIWFHTERIYDRMKLENESNRNARRHIIRNCFVLHRENEDDKYVYDALSTKRIVELAGIEERMSDTDIYIFNMAFISALCIVIDKTYLKQVVDEVITKTELAIVRRHVSNLNSCLAKTDKDTVAKLLGKDFTALRLKKLKETLSALDAAIAKHVTK